MNYLDLFSGVGGLALGFTRAGLNPVAFCEIDPFCRAVLRKYFDSPCFHDIKELDGHAFEGIDCIAGGPPCQATSVAAAIHRKRTGQSLWPEMFRIVCQAKPKWVVVEQPSGNKKNGKPRCHLIWREMGTQFPDMKSRLGKLVHLIYDGEVSPLPTLTARDYRSPGIPNHPRLQSARGLPITETLGCRISPELAEWMMGFPVGWTELQESER